MRLIQVLLALPLLLFALAVPANAQPPARDTPLEWTAPKPIPVGDAAIEFWADGRFLGHPTPSTDYRKFTLSPAPPIDRRTLEVRASGRRIDIPPPVTAAVTPSPLPPLLPAGQVDPGVPGPFSTVTSDYTRKSSTLPGFPEPIEMTGVVVAPKGAPGKRPLVLFLHGRHATCYEPNRSEYVWPCPAGLQPVPSHRGYLKAQQLLASQGYVTVSISANGINGQDSSKIDGGAQARSTLIREHLAVLANDPRIDASNVVLVGHSRGGEGANRAAMDSLSPPPGDTTPTRWTIRGTVHIGPTAFGQNPAPDVPSVTILPGCDGDVFDLQGQQYIDATRGVSNGTALHSALYVIGANHNFFNTEWTPGLSAAPSVDDFDSSMPDPVCSPGTPTRLTAQQQQAVGATYIAAATRLFASGDDRVLPLLDGSGARAPSADPARVLSHAVGGARTPFVVPDEATKTSGSASLCEQVTSCAGTGSPHFATFGRLQEEPGRSAVALRWTAAGQPATIRPGRTVSLAGARDLVLRLVVPENTKANRFTISVVDANGRRTSLGTVSLDGLPGTTRISPQWAQEVRVALRGVDQVTGLEILPLTESGQAWLIDAHGWREGAPDPKPVSLPRVDLGEVLIVDEGDSGTKTYQIPAKISGNGPATVRLFLDAPSGVSTRLVTVRPGQRTIEVPIEITGNTRWSFGSFYGLYAKAVHGAVVGFAEGGLTVRDDDPRPTVTITPVADRVTEGGLLTWRLTLSAPADLPITYVVHPAVPATGPELSSTDVDPAWYRDHAFDSPLPSRPLSTTLMQIGIRIPPGTQSVEFSVPTVADDEAEPAEHIRLTGEVELTGVVTDP